MNVFRNATALCAWFWAAFVLLTEGFNGFVMMGAGLGYRAGDAGFAFGYSALIAVAVAFVIWAAKR